VTPKEPDDFIIRIDAATDSICMGIAKPSPDPAYDADADPLTISVTTANCAAYRGDNYRNILFPFVATHAESVGSLYHFTADLSTGSLRVRPLIAHISPNAEIPDPPQSEWTIAEGIKDLAEFRVAVGMRSTKCSCTLLVA
jgi:hypothetical protein